MKRTVPPAGGKSFRFTCPLGISRIRVTGEKRRTGFTFMNATFRTTDSELLHTETPPVAKDTWEAVSVDVSPTNPLVLGFYWNADGSTIGTTLPEENALMELSSLILDVSYPPQVLSLIPAIIEITPDNYTFNGTITNLENEHQIKFRNLLATEDKLLTVDCVNLEALDEDNVSFRGYLEFPGPARTEWLEFVSGTNTLEWEDTGTAGVSVTVKHRARNTI